MNERLTSSFECHFPFHIILELNCSGYAFGIIL